MKLFILLIITAPAVAWLGFWLYVLDRESYDDLGDFMNNRDQWERK